MTVHALVDRDVPKRAVVEVHERFELIGGAGEVLGGEGVDGQDVDADLKAPIEQQFRRVAPLRVTFRDLDALGGGEPTVSVHDDGEMVRDGLRTDELEEAFLGEVPERIPDSVGKGGRSAATLRAVGVGHGKERPRRRIRGRGLRRGRPRARGRPGAGSALVGSSGRGLWTPGSFEPESQARQTYILDH